MPSSSSLSRLRRAAGRTRRAVSQLRPGAGTSVPRPLYVGWTRYSAYLESTGGLDLAMRSRSADADSYRAALWAPDRMGARSQMFLALSVPILQRMAERHDYRHVVTYSPEMPEPWVSQLEDAARQYSVLDLRPVSAGGPVEALTDHLTRGGHGSRPAVWFRVDDDDLLPTDFLDALDDHVRHVGPGWMVSPGMGYDAVWHEGQVHHVRRKHRPLTSTGQAASGWWDATARELAVPEPGNHKRIDERWPTVLDSRTPAWIRLTHSWQDSQGEPQTFEELAAPLLRNPSTVRDRAELLRRWPTLDGVLRPDGA